MPFTYTLWRLRLCPLVAALAVLSASTAVAQTDRQWAAERGLMIEKYVATAGISHRAVLAAMRDIPRHEFVPADVRPYAYQDMGLPIGHGQTISPPFIVAWMTQELDPQPTDRVLEIGTGSGYQAAVLSRLVKEVYTIEIHPPLSERAQRTIERLGYSNVTAKVGDGFAGWPEHAPFDKIIVTCSPEKVPPALVEQLREGGRMAIPVGERYQQMLYIMAKRGGKLVVESREPTYFVPMLGHMEALRSSPSNEPLTQLANGDFEQLLEPGKPAGWYYLRQAGLAEGGPSKASQHCLSFVNQVPGGRSQALQAIGVDGRRVSELLVSLWVKADHVAADEKIEPQGGGVLLITFCDDAQRPLGQQFVGPWRGTFNWRRKTARLEVPSNASAGIIAIGLVGASGRLSCDEIEVRAAPARSAARR